MKGKKKRFWSSKKAKEERDATKMKVVQELRGTENLQHTQTVPGKRKARAVKKPIANRENYAKKKTENLKRSRLWQEQKMFDWKLNWLTKWKKMICRQSPLRLILLKTDQQWKLEMLSQKHQKEKPVSSKSF